MQHERRGQQRYVVDGLVVDIDGVPREILDISASAVRIWRGPSSDLSADHPTLRFRSEPGFPEVDFVCGGALVRMAPDAIVYQYEARVALWSELLAAFDSFQDLSLPALEDQPWRARV